ncbi:Fe-S cluster assembly ATPase SufC [Candidatus Microgenomates bacterium]|nr:Fe-S cluster assembly ATPase SufC [Candidatus Microgenomates bacterium]
MSLLIQNLSVEIAGKTLLKNINLEINAGQIHVLMGPNGSGKSTLAQAIMGNQNFKIQNSNDKSNLKFKIQIDDKNITTLATDGRAREGLFLAFQNPVAIPGVSVANLLRIASKVNQLKSSHNPALSVWDFNERLVATAEKLGIRQELLKRSLNEDFSGGEKKKLEMLQALILQPKYAIFDEIDTGLDVDALRIVADGINLLKKSGTGILIITHYQRILKYALPDRISVLVNGRIVATGRNELVEEIEKEGYKRWQTK